MKKKLTVVHISRGFEDYVIALLNDLGKYVNLYHVAAKQDEWIESELTSDVQVIRSGAPKVSSFKNIYSMYKLAKKIREIKPDIIHVQNGVIWEGLLTLFFPRTPVVTTIHDVTHHPRRGLSVGIPQFLLDVMALRATALIVHGEKLKEQAARHYKLRNPDVFVIPHGVITRYGGGKARTGNGKNVLLFGTVDEWKGVEFLVKAEPLIREKVPGVNIRIAGGCRDPKYYSSLVKNDQNITLSLKRQNDREVAELFSWADVLVLPYVEASQSGVLNLGIQYCIPPVVTNVGSLPDIVTDGKTGLVVEPQDPVALADAIVRLLCDEALRARVVEAIDTARTTEHSRDVIAQKTRDAYLNVVSH